MVRTLATNVKAVGGKASRKSSGGGKSAGRSRTSTPLKASKGKSSGGVSWRSIPITKQEVPAWQKPITQFFSKVDAGPSSPCNSGPSTSGFTPSASAIVSSPLEACNETPSSVEVDVSVIEAAYDRDSTPPPSVEPAMSEGLTPVA